MFSRRVILHTSIIHITGDLYNMQLESQIWIQNVWNIKHGFMIWVLVLAIKPETANIIHVYSFFFFTRGTELGQI